MHQQLPIISLSLQVNLCFDQFVYNLSDRIFSYYRQKACILYLDKKFKDEASNLKIRYGFDFRQGIELVICSWFPSFPRVTIRR